MLLHLYSLLYSWCSVNSEWTNKSEIDKHILIIKTLTMMGDFTFPSIHSASFNGSSPSTVPNSWGGGDIKHLHSQVQICILKSSSIRWLGPTPSVQDTMYTYEHKHLGSPAPELSQSEVQNTGNPQTGNCLSGIGLSSVCLSFTGYCLALPHPGTSHFPLSQECWFTLLFPVYSLTLGNEQICKCASRCAIKMAKETMHSDACKCALVNW